MAFHVRDVEVDTKVRDFARERSVGITEAISIAVDEANGARAREKERILAAIKEIQDRVASYGKTGLKADKAFYDSLSDE